MEVVDTMISSSNNENSNSNHSKKLVRFVDDGKNIVILFEVEDSCSDDENDNNNNNNEQEESLSIVEEYAASKDRRSKEAELCRSFGYGMLLRASFEDPLDDVQQHLNLMAQLPEPVCARGLERQLSKHHDYERKELRVQCVQKVLALEDKLKAQQRFASSLSRLDVDDMWIQLSRVSRKASKKARKFARRLGHADAFVVENGECEADSPTTSNTTDNTGNADSSNNLETTTLETNNRKGTLHLVMLEIKAKLIERDVHRLYGRNNSSSNNNKITNALLLPQRNSYSGPHTSSLSQQQLRQQEPKNLKEWIDHQSVNSNNYSTSSPNGTERTNKNNRKQKPAFKPPKPLVVDEDDSCSSDSDHEVRARPSMANRRVDSAKSLPVRRWSFDSDSDDSDQDDDAKSAVSVPTAPPKRNSTWSFASPNGGLVTRNSLAVMKNHVADQQNKANKVNASTDTNGTSSSTFTPPYLPQSFSPSRLLEAQDCEDDGMNDSIVFARRRKKKKAMTSFTTIQEDPGYATYDSVPTPPSRSSPPPPPPPTSTPISRSNKHQPRCPPPTTFSSSKLDTLMERSDHSANDSLMNDSSGETTTTSNVYQLASQQQPHTPKMPPNTTATKRPPADGMEASLTLSMVGISSDEEDDDISEIDHRRRRPRAADNNMDLDVHASSTNKIAQDHSVAKRSNETDDEEDDGDSFAHSTGTNCSSIHLPSDCSSTTNASSIRSMPPTNRSDCSSTATNSSFVRRRSDDWKPQAPPVTRWSCANEFVGSIVSQDDDYVDHRPDDDDDNDRGELEDSVPQLPGMRHSVNQERTRKMMQLMRDNHSSRRYGDSTSSLMTSTVVEEGEEDEDETEADEQGDEIVMPAAASAAEGDMIPQVKKQKKKKKLRSFLSRLTSTSKRNTTAASVASSGASISTEQHDENRPKKKKIGLLTSWVSSSTLGGKRNKKKKQAELSVEEIFGQSQPVLFSESDDMASVAAASVTSRQTTKSTRSRRKKFMFKGWVSSSVLVKSGVEPDEISLSGSRFHAPSYAADDRSVVTATAAIPVAPPSYAADDRSVATAAAAIPVASISSNGSISDASTVRKPRKGLLKGWASSSRLASKSTLSEEDTSTVASPPATTAAGEPTVESPAAAAMQAFASKKEESKAKRRSFLLGRSSRSTPALQPSFSSGVNSQGESKGGSSSAGLSNGSGSAGSSRRPNLADPIALVPSDSTVESSSSISSIRSSAKKMLQKDERKQEKQRMRGVEKPVVLPAAGVNGKVTPTPLKLESASSRRGFLHQSLNGSGNGRSFFGLSGRSSN